MNVRVLLSLGSHQIAESGRIDCAALSRGCKHDGFVDSQRDVTQKVIPRVGPS